MIGKKFRKPLAERGQSKTFSVYGKSFFNITGVFLSGSIYDNRTFFNPFSASPKLSAQYPEFEAIQLSASEYSYNSDNTLTFTIPPPDYGGFANVILLNDAGWGLLTRFVVKNTGNPWPTTSPNYATYEPYERPWKDGIIVDEDFLSFVPLTSAVTFNLELTADTDGDGFTDAVELTAGTNPNDVTDFPISLFNVFNNI